MFAGSNGIRCLDVFLWLFNLRLNAVSAFPTYCILYNMHSLRKITYSLLVLSLKKMLNVRFACWLMNVFVVSTWLQHRVIVPNKHSVHFPILEGILIFLILLFFIRVLPFTSFRFLFLLKGRSFLKLIDCSWNNYRNLCWFGECSSFREQLL